MWVGKAATPPVLRREAVKADQLRAKAAIAVIAATVLAAAATAEVAKAAASKEMDKASRHVVATLPSRRRAKPLNVRRQSARAETIQTTTRMNSSRPRASRTRPA